ncbi:hypothetical protein MBH78_08380 [Oceanimonas sp. NS1]|nr:hypothetical protein [Oceanimonas sp. NS1]
MLPVPLRREFDYLCPQPLPAPGCRVSVPFGSRTLVGLVVSHPEHTEFDLSRIKPVTAVLDDTPVLGGAERQLLAWAAQYYLHPPGEVYFQALPTLLRKGEPAGYKPVEVWHALDGDSAP